MISVSISSTALILYFQKNLAEGQVLSNGPRLTTRDSRPQKRGCYSCNSPSHYTNYAIIFKTYPQSSPAKFPMAAPKTPIRTPMPA